MLKYYDQFLQHESFHPKMSTLISCQQGGVKLKYASLEAPGALAHRLQHLTARFIRYGQRSLEIGHWTFRSTFAKQVF